MNIHTDAIVFITMVGSMLIGFAWGRLERKDSATRMYRHGFNIGKAVGRNDR